MLISSPVHAATSFIASPYYLNNTHSHSAIKDSQLIGFYLYSGYNRHSLEFAIDQLDGVNKLPIQKDQTIAYSYYSDSFTLKLSHHNANTIIYNSSDTQINTYRGAVNSIGVDVPFYDAYRRVNFGFAGNLYLGNYNNFTPFNTTEYEIIYYKVVYPLPLNSGYGKISINYKYLNLNKHTVDNKSDFQQVNLGFGYYWNYLVANLNILSGDIAYANANNGFFLENSGNRYQSGVELLLSYYFDHRWSVQSFYKQHHIKIADNDFLNQIDERISKVTAGLGLSAKF